MKEQSAKGGGVIYEGARAADGTVCVVRCEIAGADEGKLPLEKLKVENVDPAPSQALYNHSEGFEWGYSGSGPAQLALALLLDATRDKEVALKFHQEFKERFVAGWGTNWRINGEQVRAFVEMKQTSGEVQAYMRGLGNV